MTNQEIKERINSVLDNAQIEILGEGCSLSLVIVSDDFKAMNLLKRQKMIMALFQDEIQSGKIHALSLKTHTQDEFNAKK